MIRQPKSRSTAEHPFGTIKCWMGATHCLVGTVMARRNAIEIAINIYLEQCCRPRSPASRAFRSPPDRAVKVSLVANSREQFVHLERERVAGLRAIECDPPNALRVSKSKSLVAVDCWFMFHRSCSLPSRLRP